MTEKLNLGLSIAAAQQMAALVVGPGGADHARAVR
jgi:hypothetical protein